MSIVVTICLSMAFLLLIIGHYINAEFIYKVIIISLGFFLILATRDSFQIYIEDVALSISNKDEQQKIIICREDSVMENIKKEELEKLVGIDKVNIFYDIVDEITKLYDMEQIWNNGGKKWTYEYKFRKGGKTLCAFYFKDNTLGFMIIFGKDERTKVEEIREELSSNVLENYDNAETFHDGKWVMFNITNNSIIEVMKKLLFIKRKPNRK